MPRGRLAYVTGMPGTGVRNALDKYVEWCGRNGHPDPLVVALEDDFLVPEAKPLAARLLEVEERDVDISHAGTGLSAFERMRSLAGMVTFGSSLPLFSFAFTTITPIKFPAPQLNSDLKKKAKWLNFYDPDDILGYPLKPISPSYRKVVTTDVAINVGGWLSSWNPASHSQYWTDNDFTKPVAQFIAGFL